MSTPPNVTLPKPPTLAQKYLYHRKGNRYLLIAQVASVIGTSYSLVRFSLQTWWTTPYLLAVLGSLLYIGANLAVAFRGRPEFDITGHEELVSSYAPKRYPSVDVFLPSAGESLDLLENTYRHVHAVEWEGRLVVYVLDDSHRPQVAALAKHYGFKYLARPNRGEMKKAGNLKYGYEHSSGDLIAILDADFVPRPDYLHELVPHFQDPAVGIVQSPQFFDTRADQNWVQRAAGSVQELFYRNIQPTRSNIGAPICVGTCALYRREALDEAGGFAYIEHSEDVHTGFKLLRAGFHTLYIPVNVAKGVCPSDLRSFFNQQYRWCAGSMSLMRSDTFWSQPLSLFQRLCFISGFSYYIFTAVWLFLGLVPIATMAIAFPEGVLLRNYIPLIPGIMYMWFFLPAWHKMEHRSEVARTKMVYAYAHLCALVDTFSGRLQPWVPTGGAVESGSRFRLFQGLNIAIGGGVSVALIALSVWRVGFQEYPWYHWFPLTAFASFLLYTTYKIRTARGAR
jgi:cellulose synthase (UDP-forming)